MLQHLDTIIAFAVVMLGVSLIITVLTQMVTNLFGLRGTNLKDGVALLLATVHPEYEQHAYDIARRVLEHPMISDSTFKKGRLLPTWLLKRWRLASAIRVEELIGTLEKLSAGAPAPAAGAPLTTEQAMAAIAAAARATAGPEVTALAEQVRALVASVPIPAGGAAGAAPVTVQLDKIAERIPASAETALRDLKSWFNSAMDRTAQRFTLHARLWTVALSILFVFAAHFDALDLLKRISSDAELRAKLVGLTDTMKEKADKILAAPASGAPTAPAPADLETVKQLKGQADDIRKQLGDVGLQLIPTPYPWLCYTAKELPGILVSAALLSLGAPFWFNVLKNLSNLRPLLATRQEKEQAEKRAT